MACWVPSGFIYQPLHCTFNSSPHPVPQKPIHHALRQRSRFPFICLAKAQMFRMSVNAPRLLWDSGTVSPWMTSLESSFPLHSRQINSPFVPSLKTCLHPTISTHVSWTAHLCSHFCLVPAVEAICEADIVLIII